jgi:tetratricopeptide (TPR) repeat protein
MFDLAKKAESLDQVNLKALSVLGMYYFFKAEYALHAEYFQKLLKSNPSAPGGHTGLGVNKMVNGDFSASLELMKKGIELSPFDPEIQHMYAGIGLSNMGLKNYQESLNAIDTCLSKIKAGNFIGFKTAALAYLDRMDEAGEYLNMYLSMRPAMKTEKDFRRLMWGDSEITTILFEGLLKAGWKPEA